MFQFTSFRFSHTILFICGQYTSYMYWVPPFRYLWVNGYLLLTTAFRSLSRLSSPLDTQAFTLRSYQLNLIFSYFRKSRIFCTNFCLLLLYYIFFNVLKCATTNLKLIVVVETKRVELLTSCLQGRRSSQLSYSPKFNNKCNVLIKVH